MQAAYNNESQFDQNEHLNEESDSVLSGGDSGSRWPIGTKVLKQFGAEWFEGAILRYDGEDELYWILYDDGDSEDMDFDEVDKAIADYKSHHPEESKDDTDSHCAATATSLEPSACVADASASLSEVTVTLTSAAAGVPTADTNSLQSAGILDASEIAVAMRAMTAAAEQLTSAAARIEVAVQQQHASDNDDSSAVQQTLLQQQQMFANHQQLLREQQSMQQQQQRWYMCSMLHQQQRYYWY
jgi:hypothetical protein